MNLERATEPDVDAAYLAATLQKPPHPIYGLLEPHLPEPTLALELGCGVGSGARWLLERGWRVWAIDVAAEAIDLCRAETPPTACVDWVLGDMRDTPFPKAGLAVAGFSLFFLPPEDFPEVWGRIGESLRSGGLFAGQLLGARDEWASPERTTHSRAEVEALLEGYDVLHLDEVEREGKTVTGKVKHWHVFHVVACKR